MKHRSLTKLSNGRWSNGWYAEKSPNEPGDDGDTTPPAIEVDGKKITADDYKNIQSKFTQTAQALSVVETAAQKYGMTPEEYIQQAEGAFGVATALVQDGIIDESGNLLVKKDDSQRHTQPDPTLTQSNATKTAVEKRLETIEKALGNIGQISDSLGAIKEDQNRLMRLDIQRQVKAKHPTFTDQEVSQVMAIAMNDRKKDLWGHAIDFEGQKESAEVERRKAFAKDYGLDFESLEAKRNANKLNETGPEGGAGAVFKSKKFSFKPKDKNAVTPREAMEEYMRAAREE